FLTPATQTRFDLWPEQWPQQYYKPPGTIKSDVLAWPGVVVGTGVIGIRKDSSGKYNRPDAELRAYLDLNVVPIPVGSRTLEMVKPARKFFWIIDDSRTKVSLFDSKNVYVEFNLLQQMLDMDAHDGQPARCSAIEVALK